MSDATLALARRLYLHALSGGRVGSQDLGRIIVGLERLRQDCELAQSERDRLAGELARAQRDIVAWMERAAVREGTVTVSRRLVESVLEDAEWWVRDAYVVDGEVHPVMADRHERDMADILALRAEIGRPNTR